VTYERGLVTFELTSKFTHQLHMSSVIIPLKLNLPITNNDRSITDGDEYPKYRKYLETEVFLLSTLLADRTNGRAYATVLRLSVRLSVCLSVTLCIVAKRCVLEQKLLLRAYMKSYMRNRLVPK